MRARGTQGAAPPGSPGLGEASHAQIKRTGIASLGDCFIA